LQTASWRWIRTKELAWYTQTVPHDLFDYDMETSPILATASINGLTQDIVIGAGKMGWCYAFNRSTRAIQWECMVGQA
jgi:quinoprotein glucose dehydrogenase